jgi:hypothetical protein
MKMPALLAAACLSFPPAAALAGYDVEIGPLIIQAETSDGAPVAGLQVSYAAGTQALEIDYTRLLTMLMWTLNPGAPSLESRPDCVSYRCWTPRDSWQSSPSGLTDADGRWTMPAIIAKSDEKDTRFQGLSVQLEGVEVPMPYRDVTLRCQTLRSRVDGQGNESPLFPAASCEPSLAYGFDRPAGMKMRPQLVRCRSWVNAERLEAIQRLHINRCRENAGAIEQATGQPLKDGALIDPERPTADR